MLLESILEKTPNLRGQLAQAARELLHKSIEQLTDDEVLRVVASIEEKEESKVKKPSKRRKKSPTPQQVTRALRHFKTRSYAELASKGKQGLSEVKGLGALGVKKITDFLESKGHTVGE